MRIKSEDILKPGAVLRTEKIDWDNEPELKKLFERTKRDQERAKRRMRYTQKYYNMLRQVITI